jgi:hypothetical protein
MSPLDLECTYTSWILDIFHEVVQDRAMLQVKSYVGPRLLTITQKPIFIVQNYFNITKHDEVSINTMVQRSPKGNLTVQPQIVPIEY